MKKLKVLTLIGTRPEAIKLAPVIHELQRYPERIASSLCISAQHREMVDELLASFRLQADYDLNVMKPGQSLSELCAAIMAKLDPIVAELEPDFIVVQGDTCTVMAASLVAFFRKVKLAHVEAGLRSHQRWAPFPEEINRRITDLISELYFAPTEGARELLLREGVSPAQIHVTGNTVVDALELMRTTWRDEGNPWTRSGRRRILLTAHRRENFGAPFQSILAAVAELATRFEQDIEIMMPVHPNPEVRGQALAQLGHLPAVRLLDPLDYKDLLQLMEASYLILTDSGGIQEEAPSFGVPTLVLREVTERPEALEAGYAQLLGHDRDKIVSAVTRLLEDPLAYRAMCASHNPFGDGRAAQRIVAALLARADA